MKLFLLVAFAWLFIALGTVHAQKATADKQGNVWFADAAGRRTRLTTGGMNSDPALSPDKRRVAYVHKVAGKPIFTGAGDATPTELRVVDTDGKNLETLVRPAEAEKVEDILADFSSPSWSPDGRTIYFASFVWLDVPWQRI